VLTISAAASEAEAAAGADEVVTENVYGNILSVGIPPEDERIQNSKTALSLLQIGA